VCACVYSILIKRKQDKAKRGKKKLSPSEQTAVRTRPKIWRIYTNICQVEQTQRGEMRSPGEMEKKKNTRETTEISIRRKQNAKKFFQKKTHEPSLPLTTKCPSTPPKQLLMTCRPCFCPMYLRATRFVCRSQSRSS